MQGQQRDFTNWYPAHLLALIVGGVSGDSIICGGKHSVVSPIAMIIAKEG
jgi:hypothetical protein